MISGSRDRNNPVPALMLTAKFDEVDKIDGLSFIVRRNEGMKRFAMMALVVLALSGMVLTSCRTSGDSMMEDDSMMGE